MSETWSKNTEQVECPHCGFLNNLSDLEAFRYGALDAFTECGECNKRYRASLHVSISVTCVALEPCKQ